MNKKFEVPTELVKGEKYTLVRYDGILGISVEWFKYIDSKVIEAYQSYWNINVLRYRARKQTCISLRTEGVDYFIAKGWCNIDFDSMYSIKVSGDLETKSSKHTCTSMKWIQCAASQVPETDIVIAHEGLLQWYS